jgi:hypothetical protein
MEQIIKLTGRIAEVLPVNTGVSQRTGNQWMSQDYIFEYFMWSGQQRATQLCVRIFGEDNIKRHNLQPLEENVTLTLRVESTKIQESGRWFTEVRVTNVERAGRQPAQQPAGQAAGMVEGQRTTGQPQQPAGQQPQGGGDDDDMPF